jgi:Rod binding domain-containing protein
MSSVSHLGMSGITAITGAMPKAQDSGKLHQAAQQFEALLIGQILHSTHSDGGWLGEDDSSSGCATDFAEEQLSNTIAQQGGFGLADMIQKNLNR